MTAVDHSGPLLLLPTLRQAPLLPGDAAVGNIDVRSEKQGCRTEAVWNGRVTQFTPALPTNSHQASRLPRYRY